MMPANSADCRDFYGHDRSGDGDEGNLAHGILQLLFNLACGLRGRRGRTELAWRKTAHPAFRPPYLVVRNLLIFGPRQAALAAS